MVVVDVGPPEATEVVGPGPAVSLSAHAVLVAATTANVAMIGRRIVDQLLGGSAWSVGPSISGAAPNETWRRRGTGP